jgi:hypothetical protein
MAKMKWYEMGKPGQILVQRKNDIVRWQYPGNWFQRFILWLKR